ncbi:MAG TPA: anti-sigma factor [Myxococcota bacterium]|nr:anti-sigma factor [Myxococcota bacterium]
MTHAANGNGADEERMVQYVLGELTRSDAEAFELRMASDAALQAEVRRLRGVFELLPYASVADPPPALREKVLRAARVHAAPALTSAPARAARRIVWSRFAAATAAAIALALGFEVYRLRSELALQQEVTALIQEPNVVRSFELAAAGGIGRASGAVVLDLDAKKGAVVLRRLPALPPEQVYRLWARVGDADVRCGDFAAGADGTVRAPFAVPVESYTAPIARLFVTIEPRAGGDRPTGPTVMEST